MQIVSLDPNFTYQDRQENGAKIDLLFTLIIPSQRILFYE